MSRERLLAVAKNIDWGLVWSEFAASNTSIKISRQNSDSLLFGVGYSILRMQNPHGEIFYAIKDYVGKKPNKKYVGCGSYATVKDALLVSVSGTPVVDYDVVVRSVSDDPHLPFPTMVAEKNLDGAIARAKRFSFQKSAWRRYTVHRKATCTLLDYLSSLKKENHVLSEAAAIDLAIRVAGLVYTLHTQYDVAHRDLKPENILVVCDKTDAAIITDMWLIDFDFAQRNPKNKTNRFIGSPCYVPYFPDVNAVDITHENFDVFALCRMLWFPPRYKYYFIISDPNTETIISRGYRTGEKENLTPGCIFSDLFLESRPALKVILDTAHGSVNPNHSAAFILCILILEKEFYNFNNKKLDLYSTSEGAVKNLQARPQSTEAVRLSQIPYALLPHNQARKYQKPKKPESCCATDFGCTML